MSRDLEALYAAALANPGSALDDLDRLDAEASLLDFIKLAWHAVEPSRPFISGWAVEAICEHLQAVSEGKIKRLLINVPPGCTKSMTTNVFWPAWEWGPRGQPHLRYVSTAYNGALSRRDNVRCRDIINSEWYQRHWGHVFDWKGDQKEKEYYENTKTGWRYAVGITGGITGRRGDRVIVDDPHNVQEGESEAVREEACRVFSEVLPTRVNDQDDSPFVVIMQRVHERDVSGLILASDLGYDHLMLPMEYEDDHPHPCQTSLGFRDPRTEDGTLLWPERFSPEAVARLKKEMRAWGGSYAEAGQMQQRPSPRGGGLFKRANFQYADRPPRHAVMRVRGWDLASTKNAGAYTAGVKISKDGQGRFYIEDVVRGQLSSGEVEDLLRSVAKQDGTGTWQDLPQDPGQAGKSQVRALVRMLAGYRAVFSPETGSKEHRAIPLAAQVEAENVYLVRGPWNDEFVSEACMFPAGRYKDQVDAGSRAFARLSTRKEPKVGAAPVTVGG